MLGNLNPDDLIRERLVQPVVDRTGVSPKRAKSTFLAVFTIGIATSYSSYMTINIGSSPDVASAAPAAITMLLIAAGTIFAVRAQVALPPHESFDLFVTAMRLICVTAACILSVHSIDMISGVGNANAIEAVTMHSMTISWIAAVAAVYLSTCREPPPRRPKTAPGPASLRVGR